MFTLLLYLTNFYQYYNYVSVYLLPLQFWLQKENNTFYNHMIKLVGNELETAASKITEHA